VGCTLSAPILRLLVALLFLATDAFPMPREILIEPLLHGLLLLVGGLAVVKLALGFRGFALRRGLRGYPGEGLSLSIDQRQPDSHTLVIPAPRVADPARAGPGRYHAPLQKPLRSTSAPRPRPRQDVDARCWIDTASHAGRRQNAASPPVTSSDPRASCLVHGSRLGPARSLHLRAALG